MTGKNELNAGYIDKKEIKPSAFLNPVPLVMCSSGDMDVSGIITVAWCGTVNSDPPMMSVSVGKSRYTHGLIMNTGHACINLVSSELTKAADLCGVKSGRDVDKFQAAGLTKVSSPLFGVPMIGESPVNLECTVKHVMQLGSHDMFIMEINAVYVARSLFNEKDAVDLKKARLVAYNHGEYYELGKILGFYGFSVAGNDAMRRRSRT